MLAEKTDDLVYDDEHLNLCTVFFSSYLLRSESKNMFIATFAEKSENLAR